MAKTKISEFSSTPANNTDIDSINIAEGCAPSGINDAIRELMSQLKDFQTGAQGDSFNGPVGTTTAAAGAFTTLSTTGNVTFGGTQRINGTTSSALTITSSSGATNGFKLYNDSSTDSAYVMNFYNGPLIFGQSNAESMRLTSTGLGIGTSSPAARLHSTSSSNQLTISEGSSLGATFDYRSSTGNLSIATNGINARTSPQLVLDLNGNLLVGTTSNGGVGTSISENAGKCLIIQNTSTTSTNTMTQFKNPNGAVGTIQTSGSSTSYNTSSDYRLKENIQPMTGALAKVSELKPCTYKWKVDGSDGEGFIAHELAEVVPQCVSGEKDAVDADGNPQYQGIDTSFLVATLTAAIQEQQAIIDSLKARLDAANL